MVQNKKNLIVWSSESWNPTKTSLYLVSISATHPGASPSLPISLNNELGKDQLTKHVSKPW